MEQQIYSENIPNSKTAIAREQEEKLKEFVKKTVQRVIRDQRAEQINSSESVEDSFSESQLAAMEKRVAESCEKLVLDRFYENLKKLGFYDSQNNGQ